MPVATGSEGETLKAKWRMVQVLGHVYSFQLESMRTIMNLDTGQLHGAYSIIPTPGSNQVNIKWK